MSTHFRFLIQAGRKASSQNLGARIRLFAMILVFIISLIGINPGVAFAAGTIYYVDNTVVCTDSGPGTQVNPFCTIGKGASLAVAGDTVNVLHGTYAETVGLTNSGTAGLPITFQAAPGVTVTGDPAGFGSAFALSARSYVVIDGFNITQTKSKGIYVDSSDHITLSNNNVSYAGINAGPTSHMQGIYLKNTTYSTITGNTTHHNSCIGIRLIGSSDYNTVSDNVSFANSSAIADPAVAISDAAGIELTGSSHNTVINNITYGNEDSGINLYVHDSTPPVASSYNLVIGNLSYGNGDHGIDHNNSPYNTVVGNTVHGNGTTGINFEGSTGSHNATVMNNVSTGNGLTPPSGSFGGNLRVDSASVAGTTLDYNIYNRESASVQIIWNNTNYLSLAAFHVPEPGQEVHGLEGDPLFTAPVTPVLRTTGTVYAGSDTTGDYHLNAGSPAIDSANSDAPSQQATDIEGNARIDDPVTIDTGAGTRTYDDCGAYEFQPSGATPNTTTVACGAGTSSVTYGSSLTCVATVVRDSGSNTPTGNVYWTTNDSGTFTISPCALSGSGGTASCSVTYKPDSVGSGSHLLTANYAGDSSFSPSSDNQTVTVSPKAATVTPNAASKVYGSADPGLNGTLTGFEPADNVTATYSRVAGETVAGGPYTISAVLAPAGVLGNYTITYNTADFTINKAAPTLSVANSPVAYNGSPQAAIVVGSVAGIVSEVKYDGSLATPTAVGTYAVVADFVPNDVANYTSLEDASAGNFVIDKAVITVTADDRSKAVGDPDPDFTYVATGFVGLDSFTNAPTCDVPVVHDVAGTYDIICSGGVVGASYTINYVDGTLTITGATGGHIEVYVGANLQEEYSIPFETATEDAYPNMNNGPLRIVSINGVDLLSSQRVVWGTGYDELMGYPANQLTNEYVFPWYNNKAMSSQLRIGNTGDVAAEVDVYIGGVKVNNSPYNIAVGGSVRVEYAGINAGPVRVVTATSGATILATMRVIWGTGYDELMGYPANQLTNEYVFPWYNNKAMSSQLRIGNTGDVAAEVDVYIGGVKVNNSPYNIAVGGSVRVEYAGINAGPVRVVTATSGATILATMRVIWGTGYDELMGYPANQLTNEYFFPKYSNSSLDTQLRIGNTGDVTAEVDVYIGGVKVTKTPYNIPVGGGVRVEYNGIDSGPVRVVTSTLGASILATERIIYGSTGYDELMGYSAAQLSNEYLFPWYNNKAMQSEVIIGVP